LEKYDPATNAWTTLTPMPTARESLAAAAFGRLYVVGGDTTASGAYSSTLERYDPATNSWTTLAPMPTAREELGAAGALCVGSTTRNCVYAVDGWNGGSLNTLEAWG
jgi:N-acetylneuraminic acid mutarotase